MYAHGVRLSGYQLGEVLGRGGMATVFAARADDGTPVAVKIIAAEHASTAMFLAAFRREVRAVARLHHPRIVAILDYGRVPDDAPEGSAVAPGSPYYVMERVVGPTLAKRRPQSWPALRQVLLSILDALAHAHARGVIHRDIKPSNVLVDDAGAVKLADFGIADVREEVRDEEEHAAAGTPSYMAPEQIRGEEHRQGPWTDLYALGAMAWRLAVGEGPFVRDSPEAILTAHLTQPPPAFEPRFAVPPGFEGWLRALLAKAPFDRPRSAAAAARALAELHEELPPAEAGVRITLTELGTAPTFMQLIPRHGEGDAWRDGDPKGSGATGGGMGLVGIRVLPTVGREREGELLFAMLDRARRERAPEAVIVQGTAGVGKAHLIDAVGHRAAERGVAQRLFARFDELGGGLVGALRDHLQLQRAEGALEAIRAWLADWADGPESFYDSVVLASAMGFTPHRAQDDEVHEALVRVLRALARGGACWIRCDDVAANPDGARALARLLETPDLPLVLAIPVEEPAEADALARLGLRAERLPLDPLDDTQLAELVNHLLDLDDALLDGLVRKAEGVPLFALQLVEDWVERGWLVPGPNGLRLADGADPRLPPSLEALWSTRLRAHIGTDEDAWTALELAAALGVRVDNAEWAEACRFADVRMPTAPLERLFASSLLEPEPRGFRFGHGLLREALNARARVLGRWAAHRALAGEALDRVHRANGDAAERTGLLYRDAGRHVDAAERLERAARWAVERGRPTHALALSDAASREIAAMGAHTTLSAQVCTTRAFALSQRGEHEAAREAARDANRAAMRTGDLVLEATAARALATALRGLDSAAALAAYQRAARTAERAGVPHEVRRALLGAGWCHFLRGEPEATLSVLEEAARHATPRRVPADTRDEYLRAHALIELDRLDDAQALAESVRARNEAAQNPWLVALADVLLADIARHRGDVATAMVQLARAETWYASGQGASARRFRIARAFTWLEAGEVARAAAVFDIEQDDERAAPAGAFACAVRLQENARALRLLDALPPPISRDARRALTLAEQAAEAQGAEALATRIRELSAGAR